MNKQISNSDDVIDSRDVIKRIKELEALDSIDEAIDNLEQSDDATELVMLRELEGDAEGYALDWKHGAPLIRDSYFKTYAMELADDIGAVPDNASWPCTCIDWDKAAFELRMDYTAVDFDGVTYWVR